MPLVFSTLSSRFRGYTRRLHLTDTSPPDPSESLLLCPQAFGPGACGGGPGPLRATSVRTPPAPVRSPSGPPRRSPPDASWAPL
eukprot:971030-Prorocentrum_minimum.AAC.2